VLLATFTLMSVVYSFQQMMVVPVLPTLQQDLHTTTPRVTWLLTVFLISSCIATPVLGRLSDQFGRKRVLTGALVLFFVGAVGGALSPNIWFLVGCRAIQGASGVLVPVGIAIINDTFPRERVAPAVGTIMSGALVGFGLGAAVSGILIDLISWRYMFLMAAGLIAVALVVVRRVAPPDVPKARTPVDVKGAVLLAAALVSVLLALTEGPDWGWTSPAVGGLLLLGAATAIAWARVELHVAVPMVNVRLLALRAVSVATAAQMLSAFSMTGILIIVPRLLGPGPSGVGDAGYGLGADTTEIGLVLLPVCITGLVAGGMSAAIGRRLGFKWPLALGTTVGAAALTSIALWHDHVWQILVAMLGFGLTLPLVATAVNKLIIDAVGPAEVASTTGIVVTWRQIGSVLGAQLTAAALGSILIGGTAVPTESAFQLALGMCAAAALVATAMTLFMLPSTRLVAPATA
jgi:MFS family permease